jgi:hypothetical protein
MNFLSASLSMKKILFVFVLLVLSCSAKTLKAQSSDYKLKVQKSRITELNKNGTRVGGEYSRYIKGDKLAVQAGLSYLLFNDFSNKAELVGKHMQFNTVDFNLGLHLKAFKKFRHSIVISSGASFRFRNEVLIKGYYWEMPPDVEDEGFGFYETYVYDYDVIDNREWGTYGNISYEFQLSKYIKLGVTSAYNLFLKGPDSIDAGFSISYTYLNQKE